MASTAKLVYLYDLSAKVEDTLSVDQIVSTMIFGSSGVAGVYDPEHVYNPGDLCTYIDDYGRIYVLECIKQTEQGPIDFEDWAEFSILDKINETSNNLVILATLRPDVPGNKVWLQYRGDEGGIPDGNYGLIIKQNFIISADEPEDFTTDIVWGKVQVA